MKKIYLVVRPYSGPTAKKTLLEVLSRRLSLNDAQDWLEFQRQTHPDSFLVEVVDND